MSDKKLKDTAYKRITNLTNIEDLSNCSEDLGSFFEAYQTHPALAPVFAAIRKKKLKEYKAGYQNLSIHNCHITAKTVLDLAKRFIVSHLALRQWLG